MILMRVALPDLARMACASKLCRVLCSEEPLWQQLTLQLDLRSELQFKARAAHMALLQHSVRAKHTDGTILSTLSQATWRQTALALLAKHPRILTALRCSSPPDDVAIAAAARTPPAVAIHSDFLYRRWLRCHCDLRGFLPPLQHVPRADARQLTPAAFRDTYDHACAPVVLLHAMADWPSGTVCLSEVYASVRAGMTSGSMCDQRSSASMLHLHNTLRAFSIFDAAGRRHSSK
jgi:hypothetical protein